MPNSHVVYLYRDASNYKFWGEFTVRGLLRVEDFSAWLFDGEFFVPDQIGLKSLVPECMNEDDHLLHNIASIDDTHDDDCLCEAVEFVARVKAADQRGWFFGRRL